MRLRIREGNEKERFPWVSTKPEWNPQILGWDIGCSQVTEIMVDGLSFVKIKGGVKYNVYFTDFHILTAWALPQLLLRPW
jgi:hypothetical protein